jgi:hypothetical protein
MRRREFITLLSSAAVAWPSATRAEQSPVPVIGLLGSGAASAQSEWTAAFLQRLRELGWSEGRNIIIDYRWGEGHTERFSEIAAEFVRRKVTLILTHNTPPTLAAKQATSTFPSCSQRLAIRSEPGSSQVWRDRVAISPGCQARHPMLLVKSSNSFSRSSLVCIDWPPWPTSIIPTLPSISASSIKPPVLSGLRCSVLKSDEAKS